MHQPDTQPRAIDVHAHYFPPAYLQAVGQYVNSEGPVGEVARHTVNHPILQQDKLFSGALEERLALMDAAGIETHILSFSSPNLWHPDAAARAELVRIFNDGCADVAARYPGRFLLFACMPLPFVGEAIQETERTFSNPDTVGVVMCTHVAGLPIDDDRFVPLYTYWNERNVTVFFHPDGFCAPQVLAQYGMDWSLGAPFEDTIVAMRLIHARLNERYPNITWIVPHLGGAFPFLLGSIDERWSRDPARSGLPKPPSTYLDRILFDTVTPSARSLRLAKEVLGAGHLVLGSDFPYPSHRRNLGLGLRLLKEAGFTTHEIAGVLHDNIARR